MSLFLLYNFATSSPTPTPDPQPGGSHEGGGSANGLGGEIRRRARFIGEQNEIAINRVIALAVTGVMQ